MYKDETWANHQWGSLVSIRKPQKVKQNWNVELKPVYLLTDCDPSKAIFTTNYEKNQIDNLWIITYDKLWKWFNKVVKNKKTINKVSAVFQKGKTDPEQRPVAFVGFSCDAEQKVFGDLASLWNIPIISTGHGLKSITFWLTFSD